VSDMESHMADLTRGLIDTAGALRGLVSTARVQLTCPAPEQGDAESILRAAELHAARLVIDLERIASGRRPLEVTVF